MLQTFAACSIMVKALLSHNPGAHAIPIDEVGGMMIAWADLGALHYTTFLPFPGSEEKENGSLVVGQDHCDFYGKQMWRVDYIRPWKDEPKRI